MRKIKKNNKQMIKRGYRFKPSRQIVNVVGDYIHDIWETIMPYGSIILTMSERSGIELNGEQIALVARARLFTTSIALTSLTHTTALIEADRFGIPLLVENGMIMYKSGLYNCETCQPGNHVVHGIINNIIPGLTSTTTAIRESLRLKEKFAFALQNSHEMFVNFSIPEIVRMISNSEPDMANYTVEAFLDKFTKHVKDITETTLSNIETYKLIKTVYNYAVEQDIKDAIDDYYDSIDGLEDMLFGNLLRSSKINPTFQSHRFVMLSKMASFDKTPNRMFIDAIISSFSVINKGSYAFMDKDVINKPFNVEYGMLPDANREVVNISNKDIVVRFDENGSYIQDLKILESVDSKYTAEHIYINDTFDMVVPYFVDSLEDIASIIPTICSVTTYSRDQEDEFNELLTDPVSHKLLCSPEVYEELYDDMWHLFKKVVVVKTLDGRMYVFNNNFELRYKISGHTVTEDYYFVKGVVTALRTMGEYLYNHTLDGIDITYLEHEDHSNDKRSYTTPHYRKGCVVKAHFRHYKSGVITFVKPHVRRGTNVINGKIVIDIK